MQVPKRSGLAFFVSLIAATAIPYVFFPLSVGPLADETGTATTTLGLMFLGSGGHVAASFFFYGDRRIRSYMRTRPGRFALGPATLIAASGAVFAFADAWVPLFVFLYWIWQTHHYTRQNHGILSFVARASGRAVSEHERTAVTLTGVAGVIGMVTFVAPYRLVGLGDYGWHLHTVALGAYSAGWIYWLLALRESRGQGGALRAAMLLVCMLFYLPLFLFEDPVAAVASYAMAHGLQYLVFMTYVAKTPASSAVIRLAGLVACIGGGGWLLQYLQTDSFGPYRNAVYGAYLGLVMWHFLLDAGVWRLSEPFQRDYMAERFAFLAAPKPGR